MDIKSLLIIVSLTLGSFFGIGTWHASRTAGDDICWRSLHYQDNGQSTQLIEIANLAWKDSGELPTLTVGVTVDAPRESVYVSVPDNTARKKINTIVVFDKKLDKNTEELLHPNEKWTPVFLLGTKYTNIVNTALYQSSCSFDFVCNSVKVGDKIEIWIHSPTKSSKEIVPVITIGNTGVEARKSHDMTPRLAKLTNVFWCGTGTGLFFGIGVILFILKMAQAKVGNVGDKWWEVHLKNPNVIGFLNDLIKNLPDDGVN